MTALLRLLATRTTRRPRLSIAALLLLLFAAIGLGISAGGAYVDDFSVPGIESQKAQELIGQRFPGEGGDSATVVLTGSLQRADAPIDAALAAIARQPHVSAVSRPHASADGRTAFVTVDYDAASDALGAVPRARLERATAALGGAGLGVAMSGPIVDAGDAGAFPVGELAGVLVALVLLLVVLRSLRAALASLLTAFVGVGLGFALLGLAAAGVDIPSLAPTMGAMLGIGAGIDYALLSASRDQEELRAGRSPAAAAIRANETAGHSAVTAAAIVLVSISGLVVTGIPFVGKVGVVAGATVLIAALVSVLLLPPLLAAAGGRMLARRDRGGNARPGGAPVRGGFAVRRPRLALALGAVVAAALIVPAASLRIGQPDNGNLPAGQTQRQAYDRLAAAFGPGFNGPLVVAVAAPRGGGDDAAPAAGSPAAAGSPDVAATARALRAAIAATPGVATVAAPSLNRTGDAALLTVVPTTSPQDARTAALVRSLRATTIPAALGGSAATAYVGGYTARLVDEAQRIGARLPVFALVVVGLSLILLALTFRSLKIAALSAVFNLVSIAAAFGIVHLLFQTSTGAGLIGVEVQPVVAYTPLFMFAILFGLSTDYNVFLLSRVREEWLRLGHVAPAVAAASARTRRTISAAGAIMIVVFLGFAADPDSTVKMTGIGLAAAIAVDITLVRLLLAPASLTLLGDRLWRRRPARAHAVHRPDAAKA